MYVGLTLLFRGCSSEDPKIKSMRKILKLNKDVRASMTLTSSIILIVFLGNSPKILENMKKVVL